MGVSVTLREITIYGYKRLAVFLLTSRFIGLTSVSQGETLFCLVSTKEFPVITMTTVLLYTLQNLCAPLQSSLRLLGFSQSCLSAQGNFDYQHTLFQPLQGLLWSNETLWPARSSISSPVNLRTLSHAQSAVTRQGQGLLLQVMCFHKSTERKCTYMVWSLFITGSFNWMTAESPPSASSAPLLKQSTPECMRDLRDWISSDLWCDFFFIYCVFTE